MFVRGKNLDYLVWVKEMERAEDEGFAERTLLVLQKSRLKQPELMPNLYNRFVDYVNKRMDTALKALTAHIETQRALGDEIAVVTAIKHFSHSLRDIFFFQGFKVLDTKSKDRLTQDIHDSIDCRLNEVEQYLTKDKPDYFVDAVYELCRLRYDIKFF